MCFLQLVHNDNVMTVNYSCLTYLRPFTISCLVWQNEELFDRKGKYFNVERVGQVCGFCVAQLPSAVERSCCLTTFCLTSAVPERWRWGPRVSTQHEGKPVAEVFTGEHAPEGWAMPLTLKEMWGKIVNTTVVTDRWNVWLVYPESPLLFPSYPQKSLHFVKRMMENVIEQCLQKPAVSFERCPSSFLPVQFRLWVTNVRKV